MTVSPTAICRPSGGTRLTSLTVGQVHPIYAEDEMAAELKVRVRVLRQAMQLPAPLQR